MKKQLVVILLVLIGATGFVACEKSEMTNLGTSEFGVQFEAINPSFSLSALTKSALVAGDSMTWDSAHLVVSNIKFEAKLKSQLSNEDSIEIEYKWHGPELVDLLDSGITLGNFTLTPGVYDEIELKVEGLTEDAGSNPVFYLEGFYKNDSGSWPVMLSVTQNVYFKTEKENVEVTDESIDFTSVIQLYLDQLMADVSPSDMDSAELSEGVIVISADSNTGIYQTIVGNLAHDHRTHFKHKHHGDDHEHNGSDDDHDDD